MTPSKASRFSLLFLLSVAVSLSLVMLALMPVESVSAARRPTRTPKPTKPPVSTPTPIPTVIPTQTPGPGSEVPGTWSLVNSPNIPNRNNRLNALSVVSEDSIWAVGEHASTNNSNIQTLVMHWDGSNWQTVSSPNPHTSRNRLLGVSAISADDVWAVGEGGGVTGPNWFGITLHWDGNVWTSIPAPSIGSTGTSELRSVSALASDDVWAVGAYSTPDTGWFNRPWIIHWDGSTWTNIPAPFFGSSSELYSVAAVSANDVWAVGRAQENNWKTLILHWDGATWSRVPSPNVGVAGNHLAGVAASGSTAWAVGSFNNGNNTLTLQWDGSAWVVTPSPNGTVRPGVNRNTFQSVTIVSADDVWAVGTQAYSTVGGAGQPIYLGYALIEHWDGSAWTEVTAVPLPGTGEDGTLAGVSAVNTGNVWAVGYYYEPALSTQAYRTLAEQYTVP